MSARPAINISELPQHGFDTLDTIWWGNNLLLAIETSMFAICIASYYYLRQNISPWPPPVGQLTAPLTGMPDLSFGTVNVILLAASCIPMVFTDVAARRGNQRVAANGLLICLACGIAALVLRSFEFSAVKFRWDSNAYGSIVWFLLGLHALHLLTLTCETVLLTIWSIVRNSDMKHRVDITALAVYWYWVAAMWLIIYSVVYLTPRMS